MGTKYKRNCDLCGKHYEGYGVSFCGYKCGNTNKTKGRKLTKEHKAKLSKIKKENPSPTQFKKGKLHKAFGKLAEKAFNWKGGVTYDGGYKRVYHNRKYILEHHIEWMNHNGFWYIPDGFVVHHIDCDKLNNNPNNLVLLSKKQHADVHWRMRESVK